MSKVAEKFAPANEGVFEADSVDLREIALLNKKKAAADAAEAEYKAQRDVVLKRFKRVGAKKFTHAGQTIATITEAIPRTTFDPKLLFKLAPKAAEKAKKVTYSDRISLPGLK